MKKSAHSKPKKLGRGLSSLLGDPISTNSNINPAASEVSTVPIEYLSPGEFQPRQHFASGEIASLSESISQHGILQPILVRKKGINSYEIIAGERRWRAAQIALLHEVPVLVKNLSDKEVLEAALVENIQRADLDPLEEASGYRRLIMEFSYTQETLAQVIGKSRPYISNIMRLETLPAEVKIFIEKGKLTSGHARPLVGHKNAVELATEIIRKGLSVRQAEALAADKRPKRSSHKEKQNNEKSLDTIALEKSLSDSLGLKVKINFRNKTSDITIEYDTLEQLDEVIERLR